MAINLGSFYTAGSKQVSSGLSSGLDTESIVKSLVTAKELPKTKLESSVKVNTSEISAYSELTSVLDKFRTALDGLRNPPGVQNEASNYFEYRSGTLVSSTSTAPEDFLNATLSPGAAVGSNKVTVTAIAKEKSTIYSTSFPSRTAASAIGAGTITFDTAATDPVNITIAAGDSLNNVVAKINAVTGTSGVEAQVIQVSSSDFRLVLRSTKTGLDNAFTLSDPSSAFGGLTIDAINSQTALDAAITVNGVAITRSTNTISDAIDNVTLNLKALTSGATVTVNAEADTTTVKNGIVSFINAYNEFKAFYAKQTERETDGSPKETAILSGSQVLTSVLSGIDNEITSYVSGLASGKIKSLQEIGITFTNFAGDDENIAVSNILTLDESKLNGYLTTNFSDLRNIFEFSFTADDTNLFVTDRSNDLSITEFDLEIDTVADTAYARDPDTGTIIAALDYSESGGVVTLKGQDGTELEGMVFTYTSTTSKTISVNLSQGIADRIYNYLDGALADDGIIAAESDSLTDANTSLAKDIDEITAEVETYREGLLAKFAALETAIASVNQLLDSLTAQDSARNSNN